MSELVRQVLADSYALVDRMLKEQEDQKPVNVLLAEQEEKARSWPEWKRKYMQAEPPEQPEQPDGSGEGAS